MGHRARRDGDPELVDLVNEFMLSTRKMFGMFGQIQVHATRVTRDELEVSVRTRHERGGRELGENVYNAFVNHLRDLLPVSRLKIVYTNPALGIDAEEHVFPYAPEAPGVGRLPSHVVLVEQVADPAREASRERFRAAWARMLADPIRSERRRRR